MKFTKKRLLLPIIISSFVVLTACQATTTTSSTQETTTVPSSTQEVLSLTNQTLPDFTIVNQQQATVSKDNFAGKPTVYVAWASWCPDCQQQLPVLNELQQEYADKVQFVFVNLLVKGETAESGQQYLKEKNYTFPYYADEQHEFQTNLQLKSIPTMIFVNQEGTIQQIFDEVQTKDTLTKALQELS